MSRAMFMDLNEELSSIALRTLEQDPEKHLLEILRCVDVLEKLDEKVSENHKLGIVLAGLKIVLANYALVRIVFLSVQDPTYDDVRQFLRNHVVRDKKLPYATRSKRQGNFRKTVQEMRRSRPL